MARSFSPAGMTIKAFYGLGARTFGNPDGASKGGGAWKGVTGPQRDSGTNPDGPGMGGGSGSGFAFTLHVGNQGTSLYGFKTLPPAIGSVTPNSLNGVAMAELLYNVGLGQVVLQLASGSHPQNFFTSISFGAPISQSFLSSAATFSGGILWEWVAAEAPWVAASGMNVSVTGS
jgi:hypothetical protein